MFGVMVGCGLGGADATRDGNIGSNVGGCRLGIASVIDGMVNEGGSLSGVGDGFLFVANRTWR